MIKLFVFDLGNVILPFDHHQIPARLLERTKEKERFSTQEVFQFMFDGEHGFVNSYEEGCMSSLEFFSHLKERYRLEMNFEEFKGIWNPIFREDEEVVQIIHYLKDRGYPLFLLSNTNELHMTFIGKEYPVVHVFDEWILSFEVGVKKPHRKIYDEIFKRIDIEKNEAFYIDDIEGYVEAAKGYGLKGMVFRKAQELRDMLKKYNV